MDINISDSAEFKRLLEALIDELMDAQAHFKLHQDLEAATADYGAEFNQSPVFWTMTLEAHMDATLHRLCKAYDLYEGKPNLNLKNFLKTIEANLSLFDEANFRERLKESSYVDSLAAHPRSPDPALLQKDLESVSAADPLVNKLTIWRHNYFAHRSRNSALNPKAFTRENPFPLSEIETLIRNGLRIMNHYSDLFSATHHISHQTKDYKNILDALRRDLEAKRKRIKEQRGAVKAVHRNASPGKP